MLHPNQLSVPSPARLAPKFEQKRRQVNNYFAQFSCKAGRVMSFYSELEFDHWALQEINPDVIALCEEPLRISLEGTSKRPPKDYVIDFWVRYSDASEEYIEVKPETSLVEMETGQLAPPNWPQVERWMEKSGARCRFITNVEIYSNITLLANAHRISALAAQGYELRNKTDLLDTLINKVSAAVQLKVFEVEQQMPQEDVSRVRSAIGLLIVMGRLAAKIDSHNFDRYTVLELSNE